MYVLPSEKHMMLKTMAFGLFLMDGIKKVGSSHDVTTPSHDVIISSHDVTTRCFTSPTFVGCHCRYYVTLSYDVTYDVTNLCKTSLCIVCRHFLLYDTALSISPCLTALTSIVVACISRTRTVKYSGFI